METVDTADKMIRDHVGVVILAAGLGTRMKSDRAKVLHPLNGTPMICYVAETAKSLNVAETIFVIGHQADQVRMAVEPSDRIKFAHQTRQLGTGHAVKCAMPELSPQIEHVMILCGDVPLLRPATANRLMNDHLRAGRDVTVVAVEALDPTGYGRIVMDSERQVCAIVEEADASESQKEIRIVNAGIYCVNRLFLDKALEKLETGNAQGEFYLTDIVSIARRKNRLVGVVLADDPDEVAGINTSAELQAAEKVLFGRNDKTA